jgi:serine/threonine-protein kinase
VHRDIKTSNILLDRDLQGRVALGDFGIARIAGSARLKLTAHSPIVGTLTYLPPEILMGQPVSPAADIYAFGVVLFEMLTGRSPFTASGVEIIHEKITRVPPGIRDVRPDVSADFAERLRQSLSANAQERPQSARAMVGEAAFFSEV